MCRHGLQAVAVIVGFAIINHQKGTAISGDMAGQLPGHHISCPTIFSNSAVSQIGLVIGDLPAGQLIRAKAVAINKTEGAVAYADKTMLPCGLSPHHLVDWQGVKKFIRHAK